MKRRAEFLQPKSELPCAIALMERGRALSMSRALDDEEIGL